MKTKEILKDILDYLDAYENENSDNTENLNTTDFLGFVNSRHQFASLKKESISGGEEHWIDSETFQNGMNTDISILIVMMFRYAKGYIKRALKNSRINSADEFSFMITLLTYNSMTKMELINMQVMEKTSGNEIINRLVKMGFVEQSQDENDKRSVRIKLTTTGRDEILGVLPSMRLVSQIVVGNLNDNEINTLGYMLRRLDHFHNDIFHNKKDSDLQDIVKKESE